MVKALAPRSAKATWACGFTRKSAAVGTGQILRFYQMDELQMNKAPDEQSAAKQLY